MLRLLADENFSAAIVRGLLRRSPLLDIAAVQEVGLTAATDPEVLEWAAREHRVVLTHDVNTMPGHAIARIEAGQRMPGVVEVPLDCPIGRAIEDLLLLAECSYPEDIDGQVIYLPL